VKIMVSGVTVERTPDGGLAIALSGPQVKRLLAALQVTANTPHKMAQSAQRATAKRPTAKRRSVTYLDEEPNS
jgi:hypothetical protein